MKPLRRISLTVAAVALTAGCAGDPAINREASVELAPMEKPAVLEGKLSWLDKGEPALMEIAMTGEGMVAGAWVEGTRKGCSWVNDSWFAPTLSWKDCEGSTGTQEATKSGDIWPLAVGMAESYKVKGKNAKNETWQTTRRCEVSDMVMVSVQDKQYPSYEVICRDSWSTRTWYISPELKRTLKFKRVHNSRGVQSDMVAILE
ncbi:hypothetical protein [Pelagibius sp.]|uniref:hypothetical protein n=1 Tax=Pelagibius sp. TaxID=1931238 RepID=UPI00260C7046|nr:hypothetical protein [Pelagibius sp.]